MLLLPVALVIMAMFFTSIYFTFRDSFTVTEDDQASASD
jgi:ABC-type sugar transport system permease subunit